MSQVVYTVTSTAKDYAAYQDKKARERIIWGIMGIIIGISGLSYIYYLLYQAVHP